MSDLGRAIASARVRAGLTREQLARRIGVATETIARYERGNTEPRERILEAIASALGHTVDSLLDGIGPDTSKMLKIPVWSEEITACLGNGLSTMEVTSDPERFVYLDRDQIRVYDDLRPPFALICRGDCLESEGLMDGFTVVVNPAETPSNGNLALVSLNDMLSVKFYAQRPNGDVILVSDKDTVLLTPERQEEIDYRLIGAVVFWAPSRRPRRLI